MLEEFCCRDLWIKEICFLHCQPLTSPILKLFNAHVVYFERGCVSKEILLRGCNFHCDFMNSLKRSVTKKICIFHYLQIIQTLKDDIIRIPSLTIWENFNSQMLNSGFEQTALRPFDWKTKLWLKCCLFNWDFNTLEWMYLNMIQFEIQLMLTKKQELNEMINLNTLESWLIMH